MPAVLLQGLGIDRSIDRKKVVMVVADMHTCAAFDALWLPFVAIRQGSLRR